MTHPRSAWISTLSRIYLDVSIWNGVGTYIGRYQVVFCSIGVRHTFAFPGCYVSTCVVCRLKGLVGAWACQRIPDNLKCQKRSNFSNFGKFWAMFGHFGPFWVIFGHFEPFWVILAICAIARTWGPRGRRQRMAQHPPTNPLSLVVWLLYDVSVYANTSLYF